MCTHKTQSCLHLFLQEFVFTELGIKMGLFVARYAIHCMRMFIKDFIVAGPELIREIRTERNEPMELHNVSSKPGQACKKQRGKGDEPQTHLQCPIASMLVKNPPNQKREERPEGRIREQRDTPQESIEREIALARGFF